jgi:hypothetical protein
VQQIVLGVDRDLVGLNGTGTGIDDDLAFGPQMMPDPAQADLANTQHPRRRAQCLLHLIDQGRIDRIHQPPVDLASRLPQHRQDRHRDQQPNHRVGPVPANRDAPGEVRDDVPPTELASFA